MFRLYRERTEENEQREEKTNNKGHKTQRLIFYNNHTKMKRNCIKLYLKCTWNPLVYKIPLRYNKNIIEKNERWLLNHGIYR